MGAVVERLTRAPVPEPVPVVVDEVVLVFRAPFRRPLPEVPVQMRRHGDGLAHADGCTGRAVPRLGVMHFTQRAAPDLRDRRNDIGPRAPLRTDRHHGLAILALRLQEHLILRRIVRGRFFQINMLPGSHRHDGRRRMPVVGHHDYDTVQILVLQHLAVVLLSLRALARHLLDRSLALGKRLQVAVADASNLAERHLGKILRQRASARIDTGHTEANRLIRPDHPGLPRHRRKGEITHRKGGHTGRRLFQEIPAVRHR